MSFVTLFSNPKNVANNNGQTQLVQTKQLDPSSTQAQALTAQASSSLSQTPQSNVASSPLNSNAINNNIKQNNSISGNAAMTNNTNVVTKIITVKNKDSLGKMFQRLKLDQKDARTILALDHAETLKDLQTEKKLTFSLTSDHKLQQITYLISATDTLIITANNSNDTHKQRFTAKINHIEPTIRTSCITATINTSVNEAANKAGISKKMLAQISNIFSEKLPLNKLSNGDKITLLRKDSYIAEQKINDGEIAAVEITSKGKDYNAIAYTDPSGQTNFYNKDGYALKSAFIRYPFKFKYISSPFSPYRYQPLLHMYRAHTGVDLAGKPGTPVKATSDGVIAFAGVENGYGNIVVIKHSQYSTAYAHLQGFAKQIHHGSFVHQGQVIGYLGDSGLSTGPHVHYEFRINGTPVDPAKVALPKGEMIAKNDRSKFFTQVKTVLAQLNSQEHLYAANTNLYNQQNHG